MFWSKSFILRKQGLLSRQVSSNDTMFWVTATRWPRYKAFLISKSFRNYVNVFNWNFFQNFDFSWLVEKQIARNSLLTPEIDFWDYIIYNIYSQKYSLWITNCDMIFQMLISKYNDSKLSGFQLSGFKTFIRKTSHFL